MSKNNKILISFLTIVFVALLVFSAIEKSYNAGFAKGHKKGYENAVETVFTSLEEIPLWDYYIPCDKLYKNMRSFFNEHPHKYDIDIIYDYITQSGKYSIAELVEEAIYDYKLISKDYPY